MATIDIEHASVNADGMQDFYWPLDPHIADTVRAYLIPKMVSHVSLQDRTSPEGVTLRIAHQYFIMDGLRLFITAALASAARKDHISLDVPPRFPMLYALINGKEPQPRLLPNSDAVPKTSRYPASLRRVYRSIVWNRRSSLKTIIRSARGSMRNDDVLTPDANSLAVSHAAIEAISLTFFPLEHWFKYRPSPRSDMDSRPGPVFLETADLLQNAFVVGGVEPQFDLGQWATSWLIRAHEFVHSHLAALKNHQFPDEMWFGCAGATLWSRILAIETRSRGGKVVSHDHGSGNVLYDQLGQHFTEYHFSDELYCYNRTQAQARRTSIRSEYLVDPKPPIISSRPVGSPRIAFQSGERVVECGRIRRVMYVPTIFFGMGGRLLSTMPDPVALDYRARLLSRLREASVDVLYKPHPEGESKPPIGLAEQFGFQTDSRPFEEIEWSCDAYVIDWIASSTTRAILTSELPVILIDLPHLHIRAETRRFLESRCYLVKAEYSSDNRIDVDWNALESALRASRHYVDMTMADYYYEGIQTDR